MKMVSIISREKDNFRTVKNKTNKIMHTDNPASKKEEDKFQRYEFSKRLASIVGSHKAEKSLVVGLYGKWGEGKTSVMNFIKLELPKDTIVVNFNPWLFSDQQHLLISFFKSIAKAIGTSTITGNEKVGEFFSEYAKTIGAFTKVFGVNMDGVEEIANKLKNITVEETKGRVDRIIKDSGKTIVVFVDDIDRLDVHEVQSLFKLVKLLGDFPNTSYVLSFDDEMVSAALAPKYGNLDRNAGYSFLEKIVQLPIKLPRARREATSKHTITLLNEVLDSFKIDLEQKEVTEFTDVFRTAFLPFIDNPRLGIRYANALSFSIPLLIKEVSIIDLMIIEGVKIFYPELYDFIRANSSIFLQKNEDISYINRTKKEDAKNRIDLIVESYEEKKRKAIIELLEHLFPQLKSIYSKINYPDTSYKKWTQCKKICSGRYFSRYFSYSIQEGDMPDAYFENILSEMEGDSIESLSKKMEMAIETYSAFDFILQLEIHEDKLSEKHSEVIAKAIARNGYLFPLDTDLFFFSPKDQSAKFIARTFRKASKHSQLSYFRELLTIAQPLEYAMEIHYWIIYHEKNYPEDALLSASDEKVIQEILINRFQKEVVDVNFFELLSDANLWRILSWWSKSTKKQKSLATLLNKQLKKKKNAPFALRLIKTFISTINSFGSDGSHTFKGAFYEKNFDAIKAIVDVELLNANLIPKYGQNPSSSPPSSISDRDPLSDETIVSIFQWFVLKHNSRSITLPTSVQPS